MISLTFKELNDKGLVDKYAFMKGTTPEVLWENLHLTDEIKLTKTDATKLGVYSISESQSRPRLRELLETMDLPFLRKVVADVNDLKWLNRNLIAQNNRHPDFEEAMEIIVSLLKEGWKPISIR